jgi:ribonuclease P protein component
VKQCSLSRNERITGKKSFSLIFERGTPVSVPLESLRALYLTESVPEAPAGIRIAVAISKRAGNAVWRNRLRRLIKESYRLQKQPLLSICQQKGIALNVVFLPVGFNKKSRPKLCLKDISPLVCEVLAKLLEKV